MTCRNTALSLVVVPLHSSYLSPVRHQTSCHFWLCILRGLYDSSFSFLVSGTEKKQSRADAMRQLKDGLKYWEAVASETLNALVKILKKEQASELAHHYSVFLLLSLLSTPSIVLLCTFRKSSFICRFGHIVSTLCPPWYIVLKHS